MSSGSEYSPRTRAERLIASGRFLLSLFALAGVVLDPAEPGTFVLGSFRLLAVYVVYSAAIWMALRQKLTVTRRVALTIHGMDLLIAVIATAVTHSTGSPFFLFFTFMLLAGAVRWQGRGAWTTGAVVITAYIVVVLWDAWTGRPMDASRVTVRFGLSTMMTLILGQLGTYQQRLYAELRQLADWPRVQQGTLDDVLRSSLASMASLVDAPAALLVWQEIDEERVALALWRAGHVERLAGVSAGMRELVRIPDGVRSFLFVNDAQPRTIVGGDQPKSSSTTPLHPLLVERCEIASAIAAALPERTVRGWILLLNRPSRSLSTDDLMLAEILAADAGAAVDHWYLSQRAREAAVADERLRVSRDLHDGILQSLTGCRLDISAAAASVEAQPRHELAARLRALERSLANEQQELRQMIQSLRAAPAPAVTPRPLRDLCARVERQWRMRILLVPDADELVPPELSTQMLLMCHEALANASRHGGAMSARVTVKRCGQDLHLVVEDDGHGFPFKGRLQAAQLAALGAGPRSLRERAEELGGTLIVTSTDAGSTVDIRIPLAQEFICA